MAVKLTGSKAFVLGGPALVHFGRPGGTTLPSPDAPGGPPFEGVLERHLCQVGGLNANHTSSSGTPYHIQIEDRGPVLDRLTDKEVRRVNLIVYANYGEANARIIHGQDYDYADVRTYDHNQYVQHCIQEIAQEARRIIEEKEQRQVFRIKCLIRDYYRTKDEATKREFEAANGLYPFLFSRAWKELKSQRASSAAPVLPADAEPPPPAPPVVEAEEEGPPDVHYPLDPDLRDRVIEIERLIIELGRDLQRLRTQGGADDILLQTCRKLVTRAKGSLSGKDSTEFTTRRLDMTRNSLQQTWRQIRSRLR
jgi:hypothetical protein